MDKAGKNLSPGQLSLETSRALLCLFCECVCAVAWQAFGVVFSCGSARFCGRHIVSAATLHHELCSTSRDPVINEHARP